jgi:hypothetical protein
MIVWSILSFTPAVMNQAATAYSVGIRFLWPEFFTPRWWTNAWVVSTLFGQALELLAFGVLISLLSGRGERATRWTIILTLCWCGASVLSNAYSTIFSNNMPVITTAAAWLARSAYDLGLPITCAMIMRPAPPLRRAWRLLLSIFVLVWCAALFFFFDAIIHQPQYRFPTSMDAFSHAYMGLFESLPLLIVLVTRQWRWMSLAILVFCIGPPISWWMFFAQRPSPFDTLHKIINGADVAIEMGITVTFAWLWHELNRAVTRDAPQKVSK